MNRAVVLSALCLAVASCGSPTDPPLGRAEGRPGVPYDHHRDVATLDRMPPLGGHRFEGFEETLRAMRAYGARHPDVYAGEFLSGRYLYVGFTSSPRRHLEALRAQGPAPRSLRAFAADHPLWLLEEMQRRISRDHVLIEARGIRLSAWGPDVYHNRVMVTLAELRPDAIVFFEERYGANLLRFEEGVFEALRGLP